MKVSNEANNGGRPKIPNRQGLYAKTVKHAQRAIDTIVALLESRNEAIRLGAAKALLNKCLPDLRYSQELSAADNGPVEIRIVSERDPSLGNNQSLGSGTNGNGEVVVNTGGGFVPPVVIP